MIKEARRQAYRYGRRLSSLTVGTVEHAKIQDAWSKFIAQFDTMDSGDTVSGHIKNAFVAGQTGDTTTDVAMGFTLGLPDTNN